METFVSTYKLFQIHLPNGWEHNFEDNLDTFYQGGRDAISALQISVALHPGGKQFDLQQELEKVQKEYPTAHITELSQYGAVHYGLGIADEKMLQYCWIIGHKNVKMFCTLTISSHLEDQRLDEVYTKIVDILDTLKIFPPEVSDERKIKDNIIAQAKYFLSDAGEFFPFGAYINHKDEIIPLAVYLENENPESSAVLELLQRAIDLKLSTGEAKIAGIGTDVFYRPVPEVEKKSAIHIQILQNNSDTTSYYVPYRKENGNFAYEKPFKE